MVPQINKLKDHWKRDSRAAMTNNCSRRGRITRKFPRASLGIKPSAPRNRQHPTIKVIPVKRRWVQKVLFGIVSSFCCDRL
jgi:hypothetical protein